MSEATTTTTTTLSTEWGGNHHAVGLPGMALVVHRNADGTDTEVARTPDGIDAAGRLAVMYNVFPLLLAAFEKRCHHDGAGQHGPGLYMNASEREVYALAKTVTGK